MGGCQSPPRPPPPWRGEEHSSPPPPPPACDLGKKRQRKDRSKGSPPFCLPWLEVPRELARLLTRNPQGNEHKGWSQVDPDTHTAPLGPPLTCFGYLPPPPHMRITSTSTDHHSLYRINRDAHGRAAAALLQGATPDGHPPLPPSLSPSFYNPSYAGTASSRIRFHSQHPLEGYRFSSSPGLRTRVCAVLTSFCPTVNTLPFPLVQNWILGETDSRKADIISSRETKG